MLHLQKEFVNKYANGRNYCKVRVIVIIQVNNVVLHAVYVI